MKKHELLKYAYDNYPKGTKFKSLLRKDITESTGNFFIDGTGGVAESPTGRAIYFKHKWAEIIPESILSGKCAIQVNNEREFKLLMEHYEGMGWKWNSGRKPFEGSTFDGDECVDYHDRFGYVPRQRSIDDDYKIIPFKDFAAEVGIEVPVFVMTSEDGVPLYVGDTYWQAFLLNGMWGINEMSPFEIAKLQCVVGCPSEYKAFSTEEAAEAWIKEKNKPTEIICAKDSAFPVKVTNSEIKILCGDTENHKYNIIISPSELEQIYTAYKSLQS